MTVYVLGGTIGTQFLGYYGSVALPDGFPLIAFPSGYDQALAVPIVQPDTVPSAAVPESESDVDLVRGFLTVPAAYAKNGRTRTVPLNSTVRAALARRLEEALGAYVFAKRDGSPLRSIRKPFGRRARLQGSPMYRLTSYGIISHPVSRWPAWTPGRSRSSAAGDRC